MEGGGGEGRGIESTTLEGEASVLQEAFFYFKIRRKVGHGPLDGFHVFY